MLTSVRFNCGMQAGWSFMHLAIKVLSAFLATKWDSCANRFDRSSAVSLREGPSRTLCASGADEWRREERNGAGVRDAPDS